MAHKFASGTVRNASRDDVGPPRRWGGDTGRAAGLLPAEQTARTSPAARYFRRPTALAWQFGSFKAWRQAGGPDARGLPAPPAFRVPPAPPCRVAARHGAPPLCRCAPALAPPAACAGWQPGESSAALPGPPAHG